MKIVDRKTFMRMPKGTVFCKFPRFNEATRSYGNYVFGITEPYVKMDDTDEDSVDFYAMGIGSDLCPAESTGSSDYDILTDMERNPGKEVAFEYSYGRDGMYEITRGLSPCEPDFDKSPDVLTDEEVQERINEMDRMESSESVQDALINEIQALVEEYILSDDTYQDIYKELNWLGIGENKDDYRLNIEIRKNP